MSASASRFRSTALPPVRAVSAVAFAAVALFGIAAIPARAAKKLNVCTIVPTSDLETAVGNAFDEPQDTTVGPIEGSCRFPSTELSGTDLNLFVSTNVKKSTKGLAASFVGTEKSFANIYGVANPVSGIGKAAYTAFDDGQGALLVLDTKNHGVLVVLTGDGVTADNVVEHGKAVANAVLPKLE
jgi:hypothetical protein